MKISDIYYLNKISIILLFRKQLDIVEYRALFVCIHVVVGQAHVAFGVCSVIQRPSGYWRTRYGNL